MAAAANGRPHFEVADILRVHGEASHGAHRPSPAQQKVMRHIMECRTAALGGHVEECDSCGHQRISYNSCRDRHCPKCQSLARQQWLEDRLERLLPAPHFHVVFTIPEELNALALANQKVVFDLLFASAAETLRQIAADRKHLGAEVGFTAVLHTWGQNLLFHPHLHCVVTGGGLSPDGQRWVAARQNFFVSVKVLGKLFRGKFLDALQKAYQAGKLRLGGSTAELAQSARWRSFLDGLYQKNWVVYAKPPFAGPEQVFRYLGRYTHRVAISNHRIVAFGNGRVTFTLKDYTEQERRKQMTLYALEFIRRFLLHVLPKGYTRIRHFGLYAGRHISTRLEAARRLLASAATACPPPAGPDSRPWWERLRERTGIDLMACPGCGIGRLVRRREIQPHYRAALLPTGTDGWFADTS